MGVPLVIIHFSGIIHEINHPASWGYGCDYGNLHMFLAKRSWLFADSLQVTALFAPFAPTSVSASNFSERPAPQMVWMGSSINTSLQLSWIFYFPETMMYSTIVTL